MTPAEMLVLVRDHYTAMWPEDEFPAEEAIRLIAETWEDN